MNVSIHGEYRTLWYLKLSFLSKVTLIFAIMFTIGLIWEAVISKKNGKKFSIAKVVALVLLYIVLISMEFLKSMPGGIVAS